MNRQEAKQMLPIIQAYAEGKEIEFRSKGFDEEWKKVNEIPGLSYSSFDYRVKPKPQYRPFKDADECWQEMQEHQPFGWVKQINDNESEVFIHCGVITKVDGVLTSIDEVPFSYDDMYSAYKFTDGTPFGVKE